MAVWHFFTDPTFSRNPWQSIQYEAGEGSLADRYFGELVRVREETMGRTRPYALLANLVVKPTWQRQGTGRRLIEWGLEKIETAGLDCWLDASPYGKVLYERYGWQEVRILEFDVPAEDGSVNSVHRNFCMLRAGKLQSNRSA
jgi:predicted N-acetyltransferase YhbS